MANEMSSREEILRRVRAAAGGTSTEDAARAGWSAVPRNYKRAGVLQREQVLELLEDRLRDYDATVNRCGRGDVSLAVAGMLSERGKRRLVVPVGVAPEWLPPDFEFVVDGELAAVELDGFDGVLTGSTLAIAETGTVVLQNVAGQGRRAVTLVPDYHLCLVRVEDVVETVPEAMDRLRVTSRLATTFVSGPSATADIEMTRIKGVHGPRYLDVILIT
jgi:L-lactate dehydrogenase complex protein LldG